MSTSKKRAFNFKDRQGEKFITNEGYSVEIIEYFGSHNCTIKFQNGFIVKNIQYAKLIIGNIRYPYHPTIHGVGYLGVGKYQSTYIGYDVWSKMLARCYSKNYMEKKPTYIGCSVDERWYNFQVFAQWFEQRYKKGFQLDKDILIKGNKIYSPETCCCVPSRINSLFVKNDANRGELPIGSSLTRQGTFKVGINIDKKSVYLGTYNTPEEAFRAYKVAKESRIKEVAEEYKEQIDQKVYEAMINWKVEITD